MIPWKFHRWITAKADQLMALVEALEQKLAASRATAQTSSPLSSPN